MTELEEAELTDGQGRALSAHRTQQSYIGYAKRTERRVLAATRKRAQRRQAFRMSSRKAFRMKALNKVRLLSDFNWLGREGSNPAIIRCHTRIFPFRPTRLIPFLIPKQKPSSE